jgi:hypothetical protein
MAWVNSSRIYNVFFSILRVWFVYFTHAFVWIFYFWVFLAQIIFLIPFSLAFSIRLYDNFFWIAVFYHKYFIIFLNIFILFLLIKLVSCLISFFTKTNPPALTEQLINFVFIWLIFQFLLSFLNRKSLIYFLLILVFLLGTIFAPDYLNIIFYFCYSIAFLTFIYTVMNINVFSTKYSKILNLILHWQCFPQKLFPFNAVWHPLWTKCTIIVLLWILCCHIQPYISIIML